MAADTLWYQLAMGSVVGKCAKEKDWEKRKPWIENKPPAYRQKQWTHATSLDMKKRPEPSSCNITICKMPRYNSGKLSYETTWRLRKIMRKYGEKMKNVYLKQSLIRHVMHSFALHTPLVFFLQVNVLCLYEMRLENSLWNNASQYQRWACLPETRDEVC